MVKVLVVDDEEMVRNALGEILSTHGHSVYAASSGRQAIDLGVRLHPDVLVTDWMLTSNIHGLHVSKILRAIEPDLQTLLVTGFCSEDLKAEAKSEHVAQILEKPIDPSAIVEAIGRMHPPQSSSLPAMWLSIAEYGEDRAITYANKTAREMYAATGDGDFPTHLDGLFEPPVLARFDQFRGEWIEVSPAKGAVRWVAQIKRWPDGGIVVFLPEERAHEVNNPLVHMLLEIGIARAGSWPFTDGVIVVDDERMIRMVQTKLLERTGCICYAADSEALVLKLLHGDPTLNIVLLDYTMPGIDVGSLVKKIRAVRDSITIIGNSGNVDAMAFEDLDVHLFLPKPWRVAELIELLARTRGSRNQGSLTPRRA